MDAETETNHKQRGRRERGREREIKGGWLLLRKESVVPVWQTSATLLDRG